MPVVSNVCSNFSLGLRTLLNAPCGLVAVTVCCVLPVFVQSTVSPCFIVRSAGS